MEKRRSGFASSNLCEVIESSVFVRNRDEDWNSSAKDAFE
jgi:hypothetical protein